MNTSESSQDTPKLASITSQLISTQIKPKNHILSPMLSMNDMNEEVDCLGVSKMEALTLQSKWSIVTTLIKQGKFQSKGDIVGITPLLAACNNNSIGDDVINVVKMLIETEGLNHRDVFGRTPLHLISSNVRDEYTTKKLLELVKGNDLNVRDWGDNTPLHLASHHGNYHAVEWLLSNGADMTLRDKEGELPLHDASSQGHFDIVKLLIENGHDVNCRDLIGKDAGSCPLHLASKNNHLDIVEYLLNKGARIDIRDKDRKTPLHLACEMGNSTIVNLLLKRGAKPNCHTRQGNNPLHLTCSMMNSIEKDSCDYIECARLLIDSMENIVNEINCDGNTPLHNLIYSNIPTHLPTETFYKRQQMEMMELILEKSIDINKRNKYGETVLYRACSIGNLSLVKCIYEKGGDLTIPNISGRTTLHISSRWNHEDCVKFIIDKSKILLMAVDSNGQTPYELTKSRNPTSSILELLQE